MRKTLYLKLVVAAVLLFSLLSIASDSNSITSAAVEAKASVIQCKGLIDDGLHESIKRRTELALAGGSDYLIYEIGTYGGLVKAADDISKYLIHEASKKAHTVAYVKTEAISAGAMISVSCQDIIMRENTKIGDCAPVMLGGKLEGVEREKMESFIRAIFETAAEANGYPAALLRAMVSMTIKVYRIKNKDTGAYEYFEEGFLPTDPNVYAIADKELLINDDRLLAWPASKAVKYDIARAQVGGLSEALGFLEERDGVKFSSSPVVYKPSWSEQMVRWLNSPAVMGVLVMLAMLGVYLELSSPGVGLPGLAAVICVVIIIGSKYTINLANWWEIALFFVGVLLLMLEFFVIPGFGLPGILGFFCLFGGIFGMLVRNPPERIPWPETAFDWDIFIEGLLGIGGGIFGFIITAWLFARHMTRIEALSGLILVPASAKTGSEMEVNITAPAEARSLGVKAGDIGEVYSALRPTGKVKLGDLFVDCVAQGEFLDKGSKVEIIEIHGNRVVVKKVDEQTD